jgi:SAM-dependent methyltransferase
VPKVREVFRVVESDLFEEFETFSDQYLEDFQDCLTHYRWIKDALHQWSRVYEYPFCFHYLRQSLPLGSKVLDAGAGVTFFPFLLEKDYRVSCVDRDDYEAVYRVINAGKKTQVQFLQADLHNIPLPSETFNAIYCISVLEHTQDYPAILSEFQRLLKPGGVLVVTFDISLDENYDGIEPNKAVGILSALQDGFDFDYNPDEFIRDLNCEEIYTTEIAYQWKKDFLPWPRSTWRLRLRNWIRRNKKPIYFRDRIKMTFCNLAVHKSPEKVG